MFMNQIDHNELNLKLTITCDQSKVTFLDIQIEVSPNGNLISDLYHTPSAANTILYATGAHPRLLK